MRHPSKGSVSCPVDDNPPNITAGHDKGRESEDQTRNRSRKDRRTPRRKKKRHDRKKKSMREKRESRDENLKKKLGENAGVGLFIKIKKGLFVGCTGISSLVGERGGRERGG